MSLHEIDRILNAFGQANNDLTIASQVACSAQWMNRIARLTGGVCFLVGLAIGLSPACAQIEFLGRTSGSRPNPTVQTAMIHWQGVPLRDALSRLARLFDEPTFLDRRVDPTMRVDLSLSASSTQHVLTQLAAEHGWGICQIGEMQYLGPANAAGKLRGIIAAMRNDIAQLPAPQRAIFFRKRALRWPRLTKPRELVNQLVKTSGLRLANEEQIPHDLWPEGRLSGLTVAEQLAVLLIGFELTYEIRPATRTIQIVSLDDVALVTGANSVVPSQTTEQIPAPSNGQTKQVYSLRVAEKPVGAVMRELARRLNWQVEFDEPAIRAAGLSLDERISFNVENVEQDELLNALLRPAGLTFRRDGERIIVVPPQE